MIYLASPYAHPDPAVRAERYQAACRVTAALLKAGLVVFSPIVHSHPLVEFGLPTGWDFWQRIDREMLTRCEKVVVLLLDGGEASVGVQEEIRLARELGKPVRYLAPGTSPWAHAAAGSREPDPTPRAAARPSLWPEVAREVAE